MVIIVDILLIFLCILLQSAVFPSIAVAGICPNVMIILISSISFMRGDKEGMISGFFAGLLMDAFFGNSILGLYSLIFVIIAFLNGKFYGFYYPEDIKLPAVLIALSDLTAGLMLYITTFLLRGRTDFFFYFSRIILGEIIYTILISLIFYPLFLLANKLIDLTQSE